MKITLNVSEENEATEFPWWLIIDPEQNLSKSKLDGYGFEISVFPISTLAPLLAITFSDFTIGNVKAPVYGFPWNFPV